MGFKQQVGSPYKSLVTSAQTTRKLVARYTVGRLGGELFVALTVVFLGWHVALVVIAASNNEDCWEIPLLPAVMVLLGGTGIIKSLSFLLQLLIVVTVYRFRKDLGAEFMSETSGIDNTMNWTYIVVLIAADVAAFTNTDTLCNRLLYDMSFYSLIVMTTIITVMFILDFAVFINKKCHPKDKEEEKEEEEESVDGEMEEFPPTDKSVIVP